MNKKLAATLGLVVGLGLVTACSDDDGDDVASAPEPSAAPGTAAADAGAALGAPFCTSLLQLDTAIGALDPDDPATFAGLVPTLTPLVDSLAASAPSTLTTEAAELKTAFYDSVTAGNAEALLAAAPATDAIEVSAHDGCGFQQVAITATEYHFDGLPARLDPGETSFKLANAGQEPHVLVLVRKKAGVSQSFDELLAKAVEQGPEAVTEVEDVLGGAFVTPGATSATTIDLTPGEYLMLCPIPATNAAGEEGPPHFLQGMSHEFIVE